MSIDRPTRRTWMSLAAASLGLLDSGCCLAVGGRIQELESERQDEERQGNLNAVAAIEKEIEYLRDLATPICIIIQTLMGSFNQRDPFRLSESDSSSSQNSSIERTPLGSGTALAAAGDRLRARSYILDVLSGERILAIDSDRGVLAGSILLAEGVTGAPYQGNRDLAVTPDGATLLTAGTGAPAHIAFSETASSRVVARLELPAGLFPSVIAAAPDNARAYVAAIQGDGAFSASAGILLELDIPNRSVSRQVPLPGTPVGGVSNYSDIAVSPDGGQVFVLDQRAGGMHAIDTRTATLVATAPITGLPRSLAVHPDGDRVYAFPAFSGSFDFDGVWEIDTATAAKSGDIVLPLRAQRGAPFTFGLAISPAGETLFVSALDYPSVFHVDTYSRQVFGATDFGTEITHILVS